MGAIGVYVFSKMLKSEVLIPVYVSFGVATDVALDAAGDVYVSTAGNKGIPAYKNDYKTVIAIIRTDSTKYSRRTALASLPQSQV